MYRIYISRWLFFSLCFFLLFFSRKEKRKKGKRAEKNQFPFMRFLRSLNTFESSGSNRMSSSILLQAEIMVE